MILIRCQLLFVYWQYLFLFVIVYILRCPPFIKIDKSLTYKGDKSTDQYQFLKKFSGGIFKCLDGFIKMVKVAPIKIKQKVLQDPALKRMPQRKERRNEKTPLLEFLESCACRMDNQISKDNGKNCINTPGIFDCTDI